MREKASSSNCDFAEGAFLIPDLNMWGRQKRQFDQDAVIGMSEYLHVRKLKKVVSMRNISG